MKKVFTNTLMLTGLFLLTLVQTMAQPAYSIEHSGGLAMISFREGTGMSSQSFFTKLGTELGIDAPGDFRLHSTGKDELGNNWYRYDQYYKNVPVLCGQYMLFEKNGQLHYARGKYHKGFTIDVMPRITAAAAIAQAKNYINARKYAPSKHPVPELVIAPVDGIYSAGNFRLCYKMTIVAEEPVRECEVFIDAHTGQKVLINNLMMHADVPATGQTYYAGQQRMRAERYSRNFRLQESEGRKIKTFNMLNRITTDGAIDFVNATDVFSNGATILDRLTISIVNEDWKGPFEDNGTDAKPDLYIEITDINGNMIYSKNDSLIDEAAVPCTFNLKGRRLLTNNSYTIKLYDYDSFSPDDLLGTFTFDAVTSSKRLEDNGNLAVLFGTKGFTGAVDAHWGIERTYDYYNNRFQRTSYDGANSPITLFLHPHKDRAGNNGNNAKWLPAEKGILFGDGSGSVGSWTTLDLCGHELTHGYIQYRPPGDLIYERESGALNESFADIFGACVESEFLPGTGNWFIGEQLYGNSSFLRSLEKPKTAPIKQPNTYGGDYWRTTSAAGCPVPDPVQNDYCGVHYNSGVQNRWFYLLSEGGTGTIDDKAAGFAYEVPGLGMETASRIAYRNMMYYLPADATFEQAYLESLKVAEYYNFLNPTPQYRNIREAWFAVGVAKRPVISSFTPTTGTAGSTTVTITGQNFTGVSYVGFNETFVQPTQFTVSNNYTQITVKVPAAATTGYISIVAGYDTVKSTDKFIICSPLTISVSSTNANTFTVNVTGGSAPYTYSIDNVNYQTNNTFTNLQPGQNHTVYVKDAYDCPGQHTFFVSNPIQCNIQSGSGGQGTTFIDQILGAAAGNVSVAYNMFSIPDRMDIYYNNALMASTGGLVSGTSTLNFYYTPLPGGPYSCVIKISAPNAGTAWNFTAYCPTPKAKTNGSEAIVIREPGMLQEEEGAPVLLYPNPASAFTNLYPGTVTGNTVIRLMSITGKQIWRTTVTKNAPVPIPVKSLPAGTYLVTVAGPHTPVKTLRLIVY